MTALGRRGDAPAPAGSLARHIALALLALLFFASGCAHFRYTAAFAAIIPPYLPAPRILVQLSGAAELLLGIMVLVPARRRSAGIGLIALMLAVLPANLFMAMEPERFPQFAPWLLWLRLPLQGVLIVWAYWASGLDRPPPSRREG